MSVELKEVRITHEENRSGEPKKQHHKMYIWIKDETVLENLFNRHSRPHANYKKFVIPKVMEQLKSTNPSEYEELKDVVWQWNQSCGCSMCPCSPGFVSKVAAKDLAHKTIHVTI